ncbi:unnamed protein product [Danaus chrysippus]|uniref:(African queen) hypothetical protein n=1 Tax=Danaus chrysippus TaxID=151541 RepID=A0A8J2VX66_9NEOP|nr:unnamed protein product [Danaus chrysippus]
MYRVVYMFPPLPITVPMTARLKSFCTELKNNQVQGLCFLTKVPRNICTALVVSRVPWCGECSVPQAFLSLTRALSDAKRPPAEARPAPPPPCAPCCRLL